jgi:predicted RecB family nuclease
MRDCLAMTEPPDVEPGSQCGTPYACEFHDRCTANKPDDWISYLPYLTPARANALKVLGIEAISAIPADFPLTWKQAIIRDATASGQPYVSPDLARLLGGYGPPACYLDFEAMMPPIPLYEGTRPYQTILFQWSLHAATEDGALHHREFLADGKSDPRRRFAETIIEALDVFEGPIIVYSAYEKTRLNELARQFPDLAASLNAIVIRLADLLPIVRSAVYLPEFWFSNSIKAVAPALCPGFTYGDLEGIADGLGAAAAFLHLAAGCVSVPEEIDRLRNALLAYCHRDTMAMVEVHRALTRLIVV